MIVPFVLRLVARTARAVLQHTEQSLIAHGEKVPCPCSQGGGCPCR